MSTETARAKPSVLLSFRARNVRSFRDEFGLSLLATRTSEKPVVRSVPWSEAGHSLDVLPGAAMFGANASGKSNVLRAMEDMRNHVLRSFRSGDPNGGMPRHPFRLDDESAAANSLFEVNCIVEGVRYEFGFEINSQAVEHEWAFHYPKGKARLIFSRDSAALEHGPAFRTKGRLVEELLRPNALFLSTAAAANHEALLPLYAWFRRNLVLAAAENRDESVDLPADDPPPTTRGRQIKSRDWTVLAGVSLAWGQWEATVTADGNLATMAADDRELIGKLIVEDTPEGPRIVGTPSAVTKYLCESGVTRSRNAWLVWKLADGSTAADEHDRKPTL